MVKILCTRSIADTLILEAASEEIEIDIQEFISVQPNIKKKDLPVIHLLVLKDDAIVIFTSKHAVNILADFIEKEIPGGISPKWNIYCISEITFLTAKRCFPQATVEENGSYASNLADLILQKNIKEVFFFCGNLRRDTLPEKLRENGIVVNEITVYGTKLTAHSISQYYEGIVFFSPSAVESFFSKNNIPNNTICFAIGKTTAAAISYRTDNKVIITEKQDAKVMMQTIINYYKHKNDQHD